MQDGCVTKDEFAKVLESIGVQLTNAEVEDTFNKCVQKEPPK